MTRSMLGYAWIKCQPHNKSAGHANPPYKLRLHPEDLAVARLDLVGHLLNAFGVLPHELDIGELAHARLLDRLAMRRILPGEVDQDLLALAAMQPAEEQTRGIRIGSPLEDRAGAGRQRRALGRIDHIDWLALLLTLDHQVARAVDHDRALAERDLLRRIGCRLHLHDALLG